MNAKVSLFRPKRKCYSICGSLPLMLLMLLLLTAQTYCFTADETIDSDFNVGADYGQVDNIEWHSVKLVNGTFEKDHPIIMYKEDFVSEDYVDPSKTIVADSNGTKPRKRKYKDTAYRRRNLSRNDTNNDNKEKREEYHALKPEKIYFDVLPETPVLLSEEINANDAPAKISAELVSLIDNNQDTSKEANSEETAKTLLRKRPKKYQKRVRRNVAEHVVRKRNPYYRQQTTTVNSINPNYPQQYPPYNNHYSYDVPAGVTYNKNLVPGNLWNALNIPVPLEPEVPIFFDNRFGGENERDRVVWGSSFSRRKPQATRRPAPPLFHDSNPQNADTSFLTTRRPAVTEDRFSETTKRPAATRRPTPPLFHDSNPENADTSFITTKKPSRTPGNRVTEAPPRAQSTSQSRPVQTEVVQSTDVSHCVWAIVNCCSSRDSNIRYNCFERYGCSGRFWGLNPCADDIRDNVVRFVGEVYD